MTQLCTARQGGPATYRCLEPATRILEWRERIADGWEIETMRCFCTAHADATTKRLERFAFNLRSTPIV